VTKRSQNSQESWIYFFLVTILCHTVLNITFAGDVVLANRGFTCNEKARMYLAEVKTPPFTKGKSNWRSRTLIGAGNFPQYVCMYKG